MPQIRILDKAVAELIAAGEVVERPASVVKELVENCIDAGAKTISVEIKNGGISLLRITDDGCGIARDDIPRAFVRHATSKISVADDLDGIATLGFRGEALASIAAVSRLSMTTKAADEDEGSVYRLRGGELEDFAPTGCPTGTSIVVEDIFFNVPARMKFLKKDASEGIAVAHIMDKFALSHPEIAFSFINNGQVKLRTSGGGDPLASILAVYGKEMAAAMRAVDYTSPEGLRVSGFVCTPAGAKTTRQYQNFFINGRYVKTRTVGAAVEEAFKGKLMVGRYPACVLNVEIDPHRVDVNVHPAKIEVRFVQEKPVFTAVYYAVKSALEGEGALGQPVGALRQHTETFDQHPDNQPAQQQFAQTPARPETAMQQPADTGGSRWETITAAQFLQRVKGDGLTQESPVTQSAAPTPSPIWQGGGFTRPVDLGASTRLDVPVEEDVRDAYASGDASRQIEAAQFPDPVGDSTEVPMLEPKELRFIGEAMGTYILLEGEGGLLLVDKHAAHERLIYERLKHRAMTGDRQILLSPVAVKLSARGMDAFAENEGAFEALGFLVEEFGGDSVIVREVPTELSDKDIEQIVCEAADRLAVGSKILPVALDKILYSIACKSAVRAGDRTAAGELRELVQQLLRSPEVTHCPHGRPVFVSLGQREIEKMFGRLG